MKRAVLFRYVMVFLLVVAGISVSLGSARMCGLSKPRILRISESLTVSPEPPWRFENPGEVTRDRSQIVLSNARGAYVVISPRSGTPDREGEMAPWSELISRGELTGRVESFTWSDRELSSMVGVMDDKTGALMMEFRIPEPNGKGVSLVVNNYSGLGDRSLEARSNKELFGEIAGILGLKVDR